MEANIPLAFLAGLLSFVTPCVLPLVPGYLATVSGDAGVAGRRVVLASLPFVAGFTVVFVVLGTLIAGAGGLVDDPRLVRQVGRSRDRRHGARVHGPAAAAVPRSTRRAGPARDAPADAARGLSSAGRSRVCAAPCVGPVLASILLLASNTSTIWRGAILLAVYSLGLALPFLLVGIGFGRVMTASRWLRDHYGVVRAVSGAILVAIGLLLFFDRFWWLNVGVSRARDFVGIG